MKKFAVSFVFFIFASNAFSQEIGIKVNTSLGGILYFEGREVIALFDNDSYTIPIERPGTYSVRMVFADRRDITKSIIISSRGITEIGFLMPPSNIRIGTVGIDTFPVLWDTVVGSRITYNVYYNTENHIESSTVQRNISTPNITLQELIWNKTYYVWVSVTENNIESVKSQVISQQLIPTRIGQMDPGGGIIFFDKGFFSDGWQYLEVAPADTETETSQPICGLNTLNNGIGFGRNNTRLQVEYFNQDGRRNSPAGICGNLVISGYNDWFLPSLEELQLILNNLKRRGLGGFRDTFYWSSSNRIINFSNIPRTALPGYGEHAPGAIVLVTSALGSYYVRAIRAF